MLSLSLLPPPPPVLPSLQHFFFCRWRIASVARHTQSLVTRQCGAIVRERAADVGYTTSAPAERPLCPCVAAISAKRESTLERRAVCSCAEGGEEEDVKRWEHGPYACNGTSAGCTFFPETRDNLRPAVSRARRAPVAPPTHPSAPSVPAAGGRGGLPPARPEATPLNGHSAPLSPPPSPPAQWSPLPAITAAPPALVSRSSQPWPRLQYSHWLHAVEHNLRHTLLF